MVTGMQDKIIVEDLTLVYSDGVESLHDINVRVVANAVNVFFGPAGGGKSSLLRAFNRLNDLADVATLKGRILFNGENILDPATDGSALVTRLGLPLIVKPAHEGSTLGLTKVTTLERLPAAQDWHGFLPPHAAAIKCLRKYRLRPAAGWRA